MATAPNFTIILLHSLPNLMSTIILITYIFYALIFPTTRNYHSIFSSWHASSLPPFSKVNTMFHQVSGPLATYPRLKKEHFTH